MTWNKNLMENSTTTAKALKIECAGRSASEWEENSTSKNVYIHIDDDLKQEFGGKLDDDGGKGSENWVRRMFLSHYRWISKLI